MRLSKQQDKYLYPFIAVVQFNGLAFAREADDIFTKYTNPTRILFRINNKFAPHRHNIGLSRSQSETSCEAGTSRGTQHPIETCKWAPSVTPSGIPLLLMYRKSKRMHNQQSLHFGGEERERTHWYTFSPHTNGPLA